MYKKHRSLVLTPKSCVFLQSPPNIKFGILNKKDKSKILYLAKYQFVTKVLLTALRFLYVDVEKQLVYKYKFCYYFYFLVNVFVY